MQQTSSAKAQELAGPCWNAHPKYAPVHTPPASAHDGNVSDAGKKQPPFCWHRPPRQHGRPTGGQAHVSPAGTLAMSSAMSAWYCARALLLIDAVVQDEHVLAGHAETSPTMVQSSSRAHDWS
jgi:hypothetical protein